MTGAAGTGSEVRLEGRISLFGQDEDLVASAREIWEIIAPEVESVARQFWVQYSRSGEPGREIGPAKLEELTRRIAPYIEAKYSRLDNPSWVETARHHVGAAAWARTLRLPPEACSTTLMISLLNSAPCAPRRSCSPRRRSTS